MPKIEFQPMPKRFMVWDKVNKAFRHNGELHDWREISTMLCPCPLDSKEEVAAREARYELIQSTNLFDKDGKEIFEGSIIRIGKHNYKIYFARYSGRFDGKLIKKGTDKYISDLPCGWKSVLSGKVIGHVLSNPELSEEE